MEESIISNRVTEKISLAQRDITICKLRFIEKKDYSTIASEVGLSRTQVYRIISTFEAQNPQMVSEMKKEAKDLIPEDYKSLLEELARLKSELAKEKLRADFYEEMVAFGKDVYGIDLKKAGTK